MQTLMAVKFRASILVALVVTLAACATQLAPLYDKALVDGLTSANADTMELIASAAGGTTKETFPSREAQYNKVIGSLDALALQAAARPVPTNNVFDAVKKIVGSSNAPVLSQVISSSTALAGISETVSKMRETDKKQGVTGLEVQAFKGQALIYMDQALTYEAALER
ncbi:hypothetical protein D3879_10040 [Pseudomonas cavernicola]|uniref:Lipoprotein n=1 Tax=Pseudomonas cavernicola TaxID=2320866 RepID=A0A418XM86_9PSED|nr:hypothetical protein [Pseudomonas cavernicola]RJG13555.1 hypothetical protein D3879_10040 [Pseudomonas cavernicola]